MKIHCKVSKCINGLSTFNQLYSILTTKKLTFLLKENSNSNNIHVLLNLAFRAKVGLSKYLSLLSLCIGLIKPPETISTP